MGNKLTSFAFIFVNSVKKVANSIVGQNKPDMNRPEIFDNIFRRLDHELPEHLYYHSPQHTRNVIERSVFLAKEEGMGENDIDLIKVAALYHDAGFLIGREDHETKSCELATKELPEYDFSKDQIKAICGMINATRIPQQTHTIQEKIVADADLFYLGTENYDFYSNQLYKELKHIKPALSEKEWLNIQLNFLYEHSFQTKYGQEILEPVKQKNIEKLVESQQAI
jgi:uncharacterized protein